MKLITTHIGADFDAFASMIAASKIYPDALISFSGSAGRNVREFLKKHPSIEVLTPRKVKIEDINHLIVVDTRLKERLGPFGELFNKKGLIVHLYDHHPDTEDDIKGDYEVVKLVGATTTVMVEELIKRNIHITPFEATILAMGIYEDTGSLTFAITTKDDLNAVAYLLEKGADLSLISSYIEIYLKPREKRLLEELIQNAKEIERQGVKIVISNANTNGYVEGISLFAHKLRDFFSADIVIILVNTGEKLYIIGRNRLNTLDIAKVLDPFEGGGHPQAASAVIRPKKPINEYEKEILSLIFKMLPEHILVGDIMSSPVIAVTPDTTVEEAYKLMLRFAHSSLPVVENNKVVGIITRKDLDKAQLYHLNKDKVKNFMTQRVITVKPDTSIPFAHKLLVTNAIGRLPVVDRRGNLVGIVTRTDLLRALYPEITIEDKMNIKKNLYAKLKPWEEDISDFFKKRLHERLYEKIKRLGKRAQQLGMEAYLVGGFVRDLLLGIHNPDIDIVIVGDGVKFVKSFEKNGCRVSIHKKFQTGIIIFPDGMKVDIATARKEYYEHPASDPTLMRASLRQDLYRRDFTVNAMAICINPERFGILVDFFGGKKDLLNKELKVLHNLSFFEDPTRIIRAIRLEQKLKFKIEETTYNLLKNAIRGDLLNKLSGLRIKSELQVVLEEEIPHKILKRLSEVGAATYIFPGIKITEGTIKKCNKIRILLKRFKQNKLKDVWEKRWLCYLSIILSDAKDNLDEIIEHLKLTPTEQKLVIENITNLRQTEQNLSKIKQPSEGVRILDRFNPLFGLNLYVNTTKQNVKKFVLSYILSYRFIKPETSGKDLIKTFSLKPGPHIGKLLNLIRYAKIDGKVKTKEEELKYIERIIRKELREKCLYS